jgi:Na+-transporting methylmalonyl-CoA/oxaloacetate decarboxylase beta subunit
MKNILSPWSFPKHLVFSLMFSLLIWPLCRRILAVVVLLLLSRKYDDASAIGIIGGADGPTAVFISGPVGYFFMVRIAVFIALLLFYQPVKRIVEGIW